MVQKAIPDIFFAKGYEDSNIATQEYLRVNNCGYFKNNPHENLVQRPKGRQDYQLLYIEKGSGRFYIKNKRITLQTGQLYIFYPHESQVYTIKPYTDYYWMHFAGTGADDTLKSLGLQNAFYNLNLAQMFFEEFVQIKNFCALKNKALDVFLTGHLLSILANISRRLNGKYLAPKSAHLAERVQEIKDGTFTELIENLMGKPIEEIKELYNNREIEK